MSSAVVRSIESSDGVRLYFRHYAGEGQLRGIVVCLHGIQSHSRWYDYSSRRMAKAGYNVYFADRRGSGLNGWKRGHADHGMRLINDVRQLVRFAKRSQPANESGSSQSLPVTLLGLSWGGKTAAAFAATYPHEIDRLALLYPGLLPRLKPNVWQKFLLWFAKSHDLRHKSVVIPLQDPALFTDEREHQTSILNDPLALHRVTSGFINSGRDLDRIVQHQLQSIHHPTLLMLAGKDAIIDNDRTAKLVSRFASHVQTFRTYPDACHTLEFAANRNEIVADLIDWLGSR
ncbi:MAG: alpha/beta fold hydrolase [Fuerstiella sp.]